MLYRRMSRGAVEDSCAAPRLIWAQHEGPRPLAVAKVCRRSAAVQVRTDCRGLHSLQRHISILRDANTVLEFGREIHNLPIHLRYLDLDCPVLRLNGHKLPI